MSAIKNVEYDCTAKCRKAQHGNIITAALTKRSISDEKLAAFLAKTCANFMNIRDDLGRSAVHMSASVARYKILEWLLNHCAATVVNIRDFESGSSPLHRALYYGSVDCAVLLLRYGASLDLLDEDTRCPLQAICRKWDVECALIQNEILVWGSNKNYNLGVGNEQNLNSPQAVDFFRKSNIWIKHVALGAYHSLFCDTKGHLYAVGHGKGGRLGIGVEDSLPAPKRVKLPFKNSSEQIIGISVSRQHSLLLTSRSLVFACGINDCGQLGVRNAPGNLTTFREVISLRDKGASHLLKVIACDKHSIVYSSKCVYFWGANQGQFGLSPLTTIIAVPSLMKLPPHTTIRFVEANNAATVVYTAQKSIFVLYADKTRSIKTPNYEDLKSIAVMGGNVRNSTRGSAAALKLLMLTETNVVFLWYENTVQFYRCDFSSIRMPKINKILYNCNQVLILSDGYVYSGKCNQLTLPAGGRDKPKHNMDTWQNNDQNRTETSREHYIRIDLQRVPNIDRAVDIVSDESFSSFAVLQESNTKYFRKPVLPRREYDFKKLYHNASNTDGVHDLVLHVDGESFAAHKFIIFSRAPGLRDLILRYLDKDVYLNFQNLTGKMFELILKHIYCNYFVTEEDMDCIAQSLGPKKPQKLSSVYEMFCTHLDKFQLEELSAYIQSSLLTNSAPFNAPSRDHFDPMKRTNYPELSDVRIICEGGEVLEAHKCVLVAHLEYFEIMFMHNWAERATVTFDSMPVEYMKPMLDYLYYPDTEAFCRQNYTETYLYNMITMCDQYFNESLQSLCEYLILEKITIRKCGEMLDFAVMYNCKFLQKGCLNYICQNLARVLCYRSIEQCDPSTLRLLNDHYKKMFQPVFDYRQITPFSEAIEDELLLLSVDGCEVDLNYRVNVDGNLKDAAKHKPKELHNNKQDAHHYEQQAISSMMRSLSISESAETVGAAPGQAISPNDAKNWSRVVDKKEQKRMLAETALKVNNVLKREEQPVGELSVLSPRAAPIKEKTPPLPTTPTEPTTPISKSYNLDLSSLMPQSQKLSQKQRKRLSSESQSWRSPAPVEIVSPPEPVPNAWGVASTPTTTFPVSFNSPPPATGSVTDPTSFANIMRGQATQQRNSNGNSFSKILADERRQRENYERMRNKSLVDTQIEETAIAELKRFYNVDNVDDETITVELKSTPSNINFSTWLKH